MKSSGQVLAVGLVLFLASLVAFPFVIRRARRPRPMAYRDELRERNRLSVLLAAEEAAGRRAA